MKQIIHAIVSLTAIAMLAGAIAAVAVATYTGVLALMT